MASYTWVSRPDLAGTQFYLSSCSFALSSSTPTVTTGEPGDYDWLLVDYADRLYDWATYCGIPGGIPTRTTIYAYMTSANTAAQINAAIAACPSDQVVYLAAGTYSLGQITFGAKAGVTLRGAGAGQTILNLTSGIVASERTWTEASGVSVTSGHTKGSTAIVVSSGATFSAGMLIYITEDPSADKWATGVGTYYRVGLSSSVYNISIPRCFRQLCKVDSVVGNTINLTTPLALDFSASLSVKAYPSSGGVSLCGIENLTIDATNMASDNAIKFVGSDRCWAKEVEIKNYIYADIGAIRFWQSFQPEIRRCYIHDVASYPSQTDGQSTSFDFGTSNGLLIDTIANNSADLIQMNGATACAVVYNYTKNVCRASVYSRGMTANHGPHGFMNLVEGNILFSLCSDATHGSVSHLVAFRNSFNGVTSPTDVQRKVINLSRGAYYFSLVGNVLGDSSWDAAYYENTPALASTQCIYALGFPDADSLGLYSYNWTDFYGWIKPTDEPDADVAATLLRHGNYDYYNDASVWDEGIVNHAIPESLFCASKPALFGSLAWPAIGPDVTGLVQNIPAKHRWDNYVISADIDDLFADES